jgi:hypothetical protein
MWSSSLPQWADWRQIPLASTSVAGVHLWKNSYEFMLLPIVATTPAPMIEQCGEVDPRKLVPRELPRSH